MPPARQPEVDFAHLTFALTPALVTELMRASREAGALGATPMSYYGRQRLVAGARLRRVADWAEIGNTPKVLDELAHVLKGDVLPRERAAAMARMRRAAFLHEVAAELAEREGCSTPAMFATYGALARQEVTPSRWATLGQLWQSSVVASLPKAPVPGPVAALYAWMAAQPHVRDQPLLRVATLNWGLHRIGPENAPPLAAAAVVHQELCAGMYDAGGLLVRQDTPAGREAFRVDPVTTLEADSRGDLTYLYERFAGHMADALAETGKAMAAHQTTEARVPWLATPPPDVLDRRIFEVIERGGRLRAQDVLVALGADAPPLRTLQRRLQVMVLHGLVEMRGSRKAACYEVAARG